MKDLELEKQAVKLLEKAGLDREQIKRLEHEFGYFVAPASKGHHLSVPGGLVAHSVNVTKRLKEITEKFGIEWPREESVYLVGMLHDLVKTETYRIVANTEREGQGDYPEYQFVQPAYGGHGSASAILIMANLGVRLYPAEAAAVVWHMGAFGLDREGLKAYDVALGLYPAQILAAHMADMSATKLDEQ